MFSLLQGFLPGMAMVSLVSALIGLLSPETVVPWVKPKRVTAMLFYVALCIGCGVALSQLSGIEFISSSALQLSGFLAGLASPFLIMAGGRLIRQAKAKRVGKQQQRRTLSLDDDDDFDVIRAEWRAAAQARRENTDWADDQDDDESILTVDPTRHGPVLEEMSTAARRLSGQGLHSEFQQAEKLFRVYRRFQAVVSDQFRPEEITADRFAGYAEQTIIGATANFRDMLRHDGALKSLRESGASSGDGERLQADLKMSIETQYDENQTIISALGIATAELSTLDVGGADADRRTDFALAELQRLSARTSEFVAREKART